MEGHLLRHGRIVARQVELEERVLVHDGDGDLLVRARRPMRVGTSRRDVAPRARSRVRRADPLVAEVAIDEQHAGARPARRVRRVIHVVRRQRLEPVALHLDEGKDMRGGEEEAEDGVRVVVGRRREEQHRAQVGKARDPRDEGRGPADALGEAREGGGPGGGVGGGGVGDLVEGPQGLVGAVVDVVAEDPREPGARQLRPRGPRVERGGGRRGLGRRVPRPVGDGHALPELAGKRRHLELHPPVLAVGRGRASGRDAVDGNPPPRGRLGVRPRDAAEVHVRRRAGLREDADAPRVAAHAAPGQLPVAWGGGGVVRVHLVHSKRHRGGERRRPRPRAARERGERQSPRAVHEIPLEGPGRRDALLERLYVAHGTRGVPLHRGGGVQRCGERFDELFRREAHVVARTRRGVDESPEGHRWQRALARRRRVDRPSRAVGLADREEDVRRVRRDADVQRVGAHRASLRIAHAQLAAPSARRLAEDADGVVHRRDEVHRTPERVRAARDGEHVVRHLRGREVAGRDARGSLVAEPVGERPVATAELQERVVPEGVHRRERVPGGRARVGAAAEDAVRAVERILRRRRGGLGGGIVRRGDRVLPVPRVSPPHVVLRRCHGDGPVWVYRLSLRKKHDPRRRRASERHARWAVSGGCHDTGTPGTASEAGAVAWAFGTSPSRAI